MCNGRGITRSPIRPRGLLSLKSAVTEKTAQEGTSSRSPRARYTRQYPVGNHLWINTERMMASLDPLCRRRSLDEMAREHAEEMAEAGKVFSCSKSKRRGDNEDHAIPPREPEEDTTTTTTTTTTATPKIRENVLVGPSIQTVHKLTMSFEGEAKSNILNPNFRQFGMGAVKGSQNNLYICQLFV